MLPALLSGLRDPAWQGREVAATTLGKLGPRSRGAQIGAAGDRPDRHRRASPVRARCRCTECESARRAGKPASPPEAPVWIVQINPVGSYGAQLVFSDGHERGIFPWVYLRELAKSLDGVKKTSNIFQEPVDFSSAEAS